MNNYKLKQLLFVPLALFAAGYSSISLSHDWAASLGSPFFSTDVYVVQCSGGSNHLEISLIDTTQTPGGGKINVVGIVQTGQLGIFTQTGDPVRADANYSPPVGMIAGDNDYLLLVHKLKDGVKNYTLRYHCINSFGGHTGTQLTGVQDE